jgi:hypothetical protein
MGKDDKYGKRHSVSFRITPIAKDRLEQVARLFNMNPSHYAKAVLYRDLGVYTEPLDQRQKSWRRIMKKELEEDF